MYNAMNNRTANFFRSSKKNPKLLVVDSCRLMVINLVKSMSFGRNCVGTDRDITVSSSITGRKHGEFLYDEETGEFFYIDNNSTNGTYVNGKKLEKYNKNRTKSRRLHDGDIIRVDGDDLSNPHPEAVLMIYTTTFFDNGIWEKCMLQYRTIGIGRARACAIRLSDEKVDELHARIDFDGVNYIITDCESKYGVSVDGKEIRDCAIVNNYSVIRIASTQIIRVNDVLVYNQSTCQRNCLEVDIKQRVVDHDKALIKDIRADFDSGDFVLILGGSGAGKTTLINAILGIHKAEGEIILNGENLYDNMKKLKDHVGYVAQFPAVRKNEVVQECLSNVAYTKLGGNLRRSEISKMVKDIITKVGLKRKAKTMVGMLSGGEMKRLQLAMQLVGDRQVVFICDEPDSGLDAASKMQQMEMLSNIAREGKIVIVITHQPDDAVHKGDVTRKCLFNKVLVLAKSTIDNAGHMAFYGSVEDAFRYFQVDRLQDIVVKINQRDQGGEGRADEFIERYYMLTHSKY